MYTCRYCTTSPCWCAYTWICLSPPRKSMFSVKMIRKAGEIHLQKETDDCQRKISCRPSPPESFPQGALLRVLTSLCMCLNALNLCIRTFLVRMSSCNVHLLYANLCEGQNVTGEAAAVWCKGGILRKKQRKIKSCHIFTRSICGNQAAGKAEEYEEAEEVAVSTNLSLSLAAARGVSGQRSPAPTRWLPGFQSLAPLTSGWHSPPPPTPSSPPLPS